MNLYSVTAVYPDGRMIETTWQAMTLADAIRRMRALHPIASDVGGEYIMTSSQYLA